MDIIARWQRNLGYHIELRRYYVRLVLVRPMRERSCTRRYSIPDIPTQTLLNGSWLPGPRIRIPSGAWAMELSEALGRRLPYFGSPRVHHEPRILC